MIFQDNVCRLLQTGRWEERKYKIAVCLPALEWEEWAVFLFFLLFLLRNDVCLCQHASHNNVLFTIRVSNWNSVDVLFILVDHMYRILSCGYTRLYLPFNLLFKNEKYKLWKFRFIDKFVKNICKYCWQCWPLTWILDFIFITTREYNHLQTQNSECKQMEKYSLPSS